MGQKERIRAHARGRGRGFAAGMASTDANDVVEISHGAGL
jgi:hypothetical protein